MAQAADEQKNGNMMMIILAVVAVLLMIGFGVGGYLFGVKSGGEVVESAVAPAPAMAETAMRRKTATTKERETGKWLSLRSGCGEVGLRP